MSSITFHGRNASARLSGAERHYAGHVTNRIGMALLNDRPTAEQTRARYERLLPGSHYLRGVENDHQWVQGFRIAVQGHVDLPLRGVPLVDGHEHTWWNLLLNTALVAGSSVVELLARIHATCELHGYVEGEHRAWLAEMMSDGLASKVLRLGQGWEDVIELLLGGTDDPVVMSYSVGQGFPSRTWSDFDGDEDAWSALTDEERYVHSLGWLRQREGLDLSPDIWGTRGFGTGWSVFDLDAWLDEQ